MSLLFKILSPISPGLLTKNHGNLNFSTVSNSITDYQSISKIHFRSICISNSGAINNPYFPYILFEHEIWNFEAMYSVRARLISRTGQKFFMNGLNLFRMLQSQDLFSWAFKFFMFITQNMLYDCCFTHSCPSKQQKDSFTFYQTLLFEVLFYQPFK